MATSSLYYLNAPSLGSATAVFLDNTLSECAPDGFYSNGVIVRQQVECILLPQQNCPSCVSYNCIEGICTDPGDGSGAYSTLEECEAACGISVRLDWSVGPQSGGILKVFNSSMIELLSINSSAGGPQSGTIYPLISELPYTIRGQWGSGSGNIIRYNLCNITDGGTIYTSGPIDVTADFEDYTPSVVPAYALVQLTANNEIPPTCPI